MTPGEMLDVIESALAAARPRRRATGGSLLTLTVPNVLGEVGVLLPDGSFGYDRNQLVRIRDTILAAVREAAEAMAEHERAAQAEVDREAARQPDDDHAPPTQPTPKGAL